MMSDYNPVTLIYTEFHNLFNTEPAACVKAPGRVDLMGSHTDYNEGFVLTLPINRFTWIAASPRNDFTVRVHSLTMQESTTFKLKEINRDKEHPWSNYMRGVALILQEENFSLNGFDGLIYSTVPLSSGLSSSAALEVATARLFQTLDKLILDPVKLALICQRAENQFVGMNCGILDQYTSSVGQVGNALLLDCRMLTSEQILIDPGISIVICDTRSKRELTGSEYPQRRAQCEHGAAIFGSFYKGVNTLRDVSLEQYQAHQGDLPPVVARRCRFIIEENQRVLDISRALTAGDRLSIRELTAQSFQGAKDLYEIVSPEMEKMMEAMLSSPGIIGARQAGAGFGGCMVAFIEPDAVNRFTDHVSQLYRQKTGIESRIFSVIGG